MKRQIIDKIKQYETIILHRHVRPDPDAYGSQIGLAELIRANYPEKKVYTRRREELITSVFKEPVSFVNAQQTRPGNRASVQFRQP